VSKERLRSVVPAYAASPSTDAFERMFERDKEELRSLGVPLETVSLDALHDDEVGYRIDPDAYELPEVSFTREERVALGLAARAWSQAGLAGPARDALLKLEASGHQVDLDDVAIEPRLVSGEPSLPALHAAMAARQAVAFDYRKPGEPAPTRRTLEPWGLVTRRGRTYVVGHDRVREAERVFRLSRIVGEVQPLGRPGAFDVPAGLDVARAVDPYREEDARHEALVALAPGRGSTLRRRGEPAAGDDVPPGAKLPEGFDLVRVPYADTRRLAAELAGLGADVVVLAPEVLRSAVQALLAGAAGGVA
jgi:proteasome accessory factor B